MAAFTNLYFKLQEYEICVMKTKKANFEHKIQTCPCVLLIKMQVAPIYLIAYNSSHQQKWVRLLSFNNSHPHTTKTKMICCHFFVLSSDA